MIYLMNILLLLLSFALMEFTAWFTHKYIMHGFLWNLHRDHHIKDHDHAWERNDFFALIFAIPGIGLMYSGFISGYDHPLFWIGSGISLYGIAYFLVHDVLIHQRINILRNWNNDYLHAIRVAHSAHHKHDQRDNAESFGFLWIPRRYRVQAAKIRTEM